MRTVLICEATSLFKLLLKYRPEDKAAKKERLLKKAAAEADGKTVETKKPVVVKYGINHVTYLIEQVRSPNENAPPLSACPRGLCVSAELRSGW